MATRRRMIKKSVTPSTGVAFDSTVIARHQPAIQQLGMNTVAGEMYRVTYDIIFNIDDVVTAGAIYHLYNWNVSGTSLSSSTGILAGAIIKLHVDKTFVANKACLATESWCIDTRTCKGVAYISNYTITALEKVVNNTSISMNDLSVDTTLANLTPFTYGSKYIILADYSVNVKTISVTNNMTIAIKDTSAFTYSQLKVTGTTITAPVVNTGTFQVTVTATKNAGNVMVLMFRPYSGVADVTITNFRIYKLPDKILDSFDRPDSASALGSADTGQTWSNINGTMGIVSNTAVVKTVDGTLTSAAVLDTYFPNSEISVDCTFYDYFGIVFRCVDANNFIVVRMNSTSIALAVMISGTVTIRVTVPITSIYAKVYKVKIIALNSDISVYLDNALIISYSTSDFSTAHRVGFRYWSSLAKGTYDNLVIKKL